MPRPPKDPAQQERALRLYQAGHGPTKIHEALDREFGFDAASLRTVASWTKKFKELGTRAGFDAPFDWTNLASYELPWEASDYLLELWQFVNEGDIRRFKNSVSNPVNDESITGRQMTWCWRVHQACPDIGPYDTFWLAQRFVIREVQQQNYGIQISSKDLMSHLAYRPWEGNSQMRTYLTAVADDRVESIQNPYLTYEAKRILNDLGDTHALVATLEEIESNTDFVAMLPSQQTDFIKAKLAAKISNP